MPVACPASVWRRRLRAPPAIPARPEPGRIMPGGSGTTLVGSCWICRVVWPSRTTVLKAMTPADRLCCVIQPLQARNIGHIRGGIRMRLRASPALTWRSEATVFFARARQNAQGAWRRTGRKSGRAPSLYSLRSSKQRRRFPPTAASVRLAVTSLQEPQALAPLALDEMQTGI
jgi:hypothetical protein